MFGQAVGPVMGGALSAGFGFRYGFHNIRTDICPANRTSSSIFWFLLIVSLIVIILLTLFLPETLRKIAGSGNAQLKGIYRPLINLGSKPTSPPQPYKLEKPSFSTFLDSFQLLLEKDVFVTLLFGSIIYAIWSMVTSSTASLFKEEYHLNDVLIGLAFFPNGTPRFLYLF
jgi:MFS family permease